VSEEATDPTGWERAQLRRAKPVGASLSVRVPADLAVSVETYAQAHHLTVSDVLRQSVEQFLTETPSAMPPVYYFFVSGTTAGTYLRTGGPMTLEPRMTQGSGASTIQPRPLPLFEGIH
jgi:hypothetical protein